MERNTDTPEARAKFIGALNVFVDAAGQVSDRFIDTDSANDAYPKYLPSFDEFEHDLMAWRDAITEELAPKPLTLTDAVVALVEARNALATVRAFLHADETDNYAHVDRSAEYAQQFVQDALDRSGMSDDDLPRP